MSAAFAVCVLTACTGDRPSFGRIDPPESDAATTDESSSVPDSDAGSGTADGTSTEAQDDGTSTTQDDTSTTLEDDDAACNDQANDGCECTTDMLEACDDTLACTDEVCSSGACSNPIMAGFCLIDGQCYGPEQTQPGNICSVCNPAQNQSEWSAVPHGTGNPSNPCEVCSDGRLVANTGANCGSASTECSAQDTCDSDAVCQPNHESDGIACSEGECNAGECEPLPFDCIAPTPPEVTEPSNRYTFEDQTPPEGKGGTVRDGVYTHTRVDIYGTSTPPTIPVRTYEVRSQYVQIGVRDWTGSFFAIGEIQFAGSFTAANNTLTWDLENCDPQYDIPVPSMEYTATANGLITIETRPSDVVIVTTFARN